MDALIDFRSYFAMSGASLSATKSRGTPGKNDGRSFDIALSAIPSSNRGIITSFPAWLIPKFIATIPNEWKNGRMHITPSFPRSKPVMHGATCSTLDTMLRWLSIAPLLSPVVPPV